MSDVENKRSYLASLYGGTRRWRRQLDKMSDEQVISIYFKEQRKARPEHLKSLAEPPSSHLNLPPRPPHENEDQFPIY